MEVTITRGTHEIVALLVKLVMATGLSRTLVMKTGEGFVATAEYGELGSEACSLAF